MKGLLERLKAGKNNTKKIIFPGTDQSVYLKILSCSERQKAAIDAENHFKAKEIEISMVNADVFESEKDIRLIFLSVKDADGKPICDNIDIFRNKINDTERAALIREYNLFEEECSPYLNEISKEKFDELLFNIKKKPAQTIGSVSNIVIARKLIICLVSHPET